MIYFIDLREEQELTQSRIIPKNDEITVLSIPSRYIFANKKYIEKISKDSSVYLLCRSGNRSSQIKNKYFPNNNNVISIDGGIKSLNQFNDKIEILKGNGGYGMQQYMQFVFTFILALTITAIYYNLPKYYLISALTLFIVFILYQVFANSCLLSKIIPYKS